MNESLRKTIFVSLWIIAICLICNLLFNPMLCVREYIDKYNSTGQINREFVNNDSKECYTIIGMFKAKKLYDERALQRLTQNELKDYPNNLSFPFNESSGFPFSVSSSS